MLAVIQFQFAFSLYHRISKSKTKVSYQFILFIFLDGSYRKCDCVYVRVPLYYCFFTKKNSVSVLEKKKKILKFSLKNPNLKICYFPPNKTL